MCCQCCCHCGCGGGWGDGGGGGAGCGCGSRHHGEGHGRGHGRQFLTKAEKIERLKNYAEELRKELAAVEEHIKELKK